MRDADPSHFGQTAHWQHAAQAFSFWLAASMFFNGCAGAPNITTRQMTFAIDATLKPARPALPGLDGLSTRPLARLVGPRGHPVDFVENELVLVTDDPTTLNGFMARWEGVLVASLVPADYGLTGSSQHLIRVNPNRANPATLLDDLAVVAPMVRRGAHRVSSQAGLNLLAGASHEAIAGARVGVNWVGKPGDFVSRKTSESPSGPSASAIPSCCPNEFGPGGYSRNAYDWNYLNDKTGLDIGVTEAWRVLALAGKLGNKVDLAILDQGFLPNADFPAGGTAWSVGAFDPIGTIGLDDPWHGTKVVGAAMGVPDNNFGAAGPGGPVARPILIYTSYDPWSSSVALMNAFALGANIINMSYSWPVPAALSFTVLPFEFTTLIVRAAGVLIFASAGNDGDDVDAEDCFGACWEEEWVTPCENGGVICVGGLGIGSTWRAGNSNWGVHGGVQIFAPYTVLVGPDAAPLSNLAQIRNGTSFSSPYVAGVAALIWAADPSRSAGQVEATLMVHARSSPDHLVTRIVNAFESVKAVLGHIPPGVRIVQPANGAKVEPGGFNLVTFEATVDSYDGACCGVAWSSDKDGSMGNGSVIQFLFGNLGTRLVTATATDASGATSTATVTVNVAGNTPPTVKILMPTPGQTLYRGVPYVFQATAFDPNEDPLTFPCSSLKWVAQKTLSNLKFFGDGCWPQFTFPEAGPQGGSYKITLTGTDSVGATGVDVVSVQLVALPPTGPPVVTILSPNSGILLDFWKTVTLNGTVKDPDGKSPVSYKWIVKDGASDSVLVTGASLSGAPGGATAQWKPLNNVVPGCGAKSVTLVLEASDVDGETMSASVDVSVLFPPC